MKMKLLLGGSPCTHWSIAQTKNRETKPEGLGWELFENYLIALEKFKPDFFLYENNKSMSQAIRAQITRELGVEPILINSALVSAQNRQRLYWTNIPGVEQPEDCGILLRDILESGLPLKEKGYTLKANYAKAGAVNGVCGQHFPAPMAAEPVRIGTIESDAKNADFDSQQYRVYSPDGKSVTLCGQGGGVGAKTGLYAAPVRVGDMPNASGEVSGSQSGRIYSVDGKGVPLQARPNGGGADGAATGLYAAPTPIECNPLQSCDVVVTDQNIRCTYKDGSGTAQGYTVYFDDVKGPSVIAGHAHKMKIIEPATGKEWPVYEVRDGQITIKGRQYPIKLADGFYIIRKLTVTECKRLQPVPEEYIFPVSDTQAYKMLGNGWTVDVIAHILSYCPGITEKTLKVLSMYDGMSCGRLALDKLGARIARYYATEIDKYAIKTTQRNFPDTIQLGDAFQVRDDGWALEACREGAHMDSGYLNFLRGKIQVAPQTGFDVSPEQINPALKPHQRDAVIWACRGGRRALFESFGLGKTVQELEWCRLTAAHEGGQALIVLPLGVRQEFSRDAAELLGVDAPPYVRTMEEVGKWPDAPILMTNYERVRDGDINPAAFCAAALDEASVLRSFGSKTYQTFLDKFRGVKYKLVCTATPSPNRYKELIHYAGYLEVMDTGQALTRFFQRDSTKADNMTLYPHKEDEFWLWLSTWALVITKPSDLGYDDEGYDLPPLEVRRHVVSDHYNDNQDRDGQYKIINDAAMSMSEASREKRESIAARVAKAKELVDADPQAHFLLWHDREAERHAIRGAMPEAVDVYGSMDYDERERRVIDFSEGRTRLFATKKSLSGSGCNFQRHCHRAIFVGIDYEFNDFIQAVHRIYRFLQTEPVVVDIICTEAEGAIYRALMAKWEQHNHLQARMREIVKKYGLGGAQAAEQMARSIGVERVEVKGENFTAVNNDCVEETAGMEENSVDLIVTSIPFSNHYEYTPSYNDFGHNEDTARFFEQMDYLTPNLLRVLKPGRNFCCHVKDRVMFGNVTGLGFPTMEPFHALCIQHYMRHGFAYMGMITVLTDVVRENNQTYRLGWSENGKDGTKMGVGCPEYILLFRKPQTDRSKGYADEPVRKSKEEYTRAQWQLDAHGYWRSSGDRLMSKEELAGVPVDRLQAAYRKYSRGTVYSYEEHVALAKKLDADGHLPATFMVVAPGSWTDQVWDDINRMRTLNTTQSQRRQALHVCPLQLDVVDRLINRYSNPGDLVLDPFGGLGTVALEAMKAGRRGYTIELNNDYFRDAVGYLKEFEAKEETLSLFDMIG